MFSGGFIFFYRELRFIHKVNMFSEACDFLGGLRFFKRKIIKIS